MDTTRIRPAVLADVPALIALEDTCFRTDRISPRQMRYLLQRARALTLVLNRECDGTVELAGYACCLTPAAGRPPRLYSLAVAPERRGRGYASALLRECVHELYALGYRRLRLEVRAGDKHTQALYRSFGFTELERIENYYEDGEAALRMQASLADAGPGDLLAVGRV